MALADNYEAYLPHIDAVAGIKRIMNNKKLYVTMLARFKPRQMADTLLEAMKDGDHEKVGFAAHALKGTAGNLGFPTLAVLTGEIEDLAKAKKDASHMAGILDELIAVVMAALQDFIAKEG
jgi:HPt (histidine-containing phosphotransfer) domain-containing protein